MTSGNPKRLQTGPVAANAAPSDWSRTMSVPTVREAAARVGRLRMTRAAGDPELVVARQQLAAANIEVAIDKNLAKAPLTPAQAARLVTILIGGAR